MPKKNAPEFSYSEKTGLYRKRIKNPASGKWIDIYGHTKPELRAKIKERALQLSSDAAAESSPYVYQYAAKWYRLNTGTVGDKRRQDYTNAINNHICPVIGDMQMTDVTSDDIKSVMTAAAALSHSSQTKIVTTLKRIFDAAEDSGVIVRSPCKNLKPAGAPTKEKVPLTEAQQQTLLAALADVPMALTFVSIGLGTGMRREEILALQWDDVHIDEDTPYISVRRALRWQQNRPAVSSTLKSKAAKRDIPIPPQLAQVLKEAKSSSKSEYVICDTDGEPMTSISFRRRVLDPIKTRSVHEVTRRDADGKPYKYQLKVGDKIRNHDIVVSIDFPVTPHLLRHTYITRLILAGVDIKTVQYLAGHTNVQLTLDIYTHLMANRPEDTSNAVMQAFGGKPGGN